MKKFLSLVIAVLAVVGSMAQDLISVADLKKNAANTVLIDARKADEYTKVHIKDAISIYHGSLCDDAPIKSVVKSPDALAKMFGDAGVGQGDAIVVYDEGSGKYAGRLYWILKYLGAKNVRMLDGNLTAWKAARGAITKAPSKRKATTFAPTVNKAVWASMADVKKANGNAKAVVVDVRPAAEYNGTEGQTDRLGHIPGAVNLDHAKLLATGDLMKPKAELQQMMTAAGITPDKEVILYCTSSVRAGIVFLALTTILDYPNVKVYDGAFYEWTSVAANKVEK